MEAINCPTRHATFTLFTQLPTELRLKIYGHSLAAPRLVPIRYLGAVGGSGGYTRPHHGCTSPALIPALLHVSRESRTSAQKFYTLSFNLDGPVHMFPPKVWFSNGKGGDDVLYFEPQAGYLASFKHFLTAMMVLEPREALKVRRLAVHEDLFLQVRRERGPFDWNPNSNRSKDTLINRCIRDFWEHVKTKFRCVEELIVVGAGMEKRILKGKLLSTEVLAAESRKQAPRDQEVLAAKFNIAVAQLQDKDCSWAAPKWKMLSLPGHLAAGNVVGDRDVGTARNMYDNGVFSMEKLQRVICEEETCFDRVGGLGVMSL